MVRRILRFTAVGMICLFLQLALMKLTEPYFLPWVANGIGFVVSAQLNFTLSYVFTWRDSKRQTGWRLVATWSKYCILAVAAAFINAAAFVAIYATLPSPTELIVILATVASTCCTFLFNHFLVFRSERRRHDQARDSIVYASMERG